MLLSEMQLKISLAGWLVLETGFHKIWICKSLLPDLQLSDSLSSKFPLTSDGVFPSAETEGACSTDVSLLQGVTSSTPSDTSSCQYHGARGGFFRQWTNPRNPVGKFGSHDNALVTHLPHLPLLQLQWVRLQGLMVLDSFWTQHV